MVLLAQQEEQKSSFFKFLKNKLISVFKKSRSSQNPLVRKTEISRLAHDDVVKHFDVEIFCRLLDLFCDLFVLPAGFKTARRVVMAKNNTDGIFFQSLF